MCYHSKVFAPQEQFAEENDYEEENYGSDCFSSFSGSAGFVRRDVAEYDCKGSSNHREGGNNGRDDCESSGNHGKGSDIGCGNHKSSGGNHQGCGSISRRYGGLYRKDFYGRVRPGFPAHGI